MTQHNTVAQFIIRLYGDNVFLNKNKRLITIFIVFLFILIALDPIISIIGEVESPKIFSRIGRLENDLSFRSDIKFDSSPAILQYTEPTTPQSQRDTNSGYEIITRIVCGENLHNDSGNESYLSCFENDISATKENKVSWKYFISDEFGIYSSPAVANIDPTTDTPEIVFGADNGCIYCLNTDGKLLWKYILDDLVQFPIRSSPAIADIYDDPNTDADDGYLEIIIGSDKNDLYSIHYDTGTSQWKAKNKFTTQGKIISSPAIADIDDDGYLNIVVGSDDGKVYCLDHQLKKKWDFDTGSPVRSTAGIADINRDGALEIIIGSDNGNIYCLDKNGNQIDSYLIGTPIRSSPAIANIIPSDEDLEFIVGFASGTGSSSTQAACFKLEDDTGPWKINNKWTFSKDYTQNLNLKLNVIAVDKNEYPDGVYEVIVTDGYSIFILDSQGNKVTEYPNHLHGGSPVVADIDNDGKLEITVGHQITDLDPNTEHLLIEQTNYKCPPHIIKWGMFGAGEKHNGNGDNRYAILIEGSKGDNAFEQDQFRSGIQEIARIITVHPDYKGLGYTGHYLRDHIFYVGVHDDIPDVDVFKKIPENNDLNNPNNNAPDDVRGKNSIFEAINKVAGLCDSYDSVIFYYTSHGKYNGSPYENRNYLFDANDCHEPYSNTGDLSPSELNVALNKISCLKLFIILQPCYSGNWIEYLNDKGNRVIIASDLATNPGAQIKIAVFDKCNIIISDSSAHDLYWVGNLKKDETTIESIDDSDPKVDNEEYDDDDTDLQEFGKTYHQWYCWVKKMSSNTELYEIDKDRSNNLDVNGNPQFNKMFYENFKDSGAEFVSGLIEAFYKDYLTGSTPDSNNILDADENTINRYLETNGDSNGYISCQEAFDFMTLWHFGIQIKKVWEDYPIISYTKLPEGENYLLF